MKTLLRLPLQSRVWVSWNQTLAWHSRQSSEQGMISLARATDFRISPDQSSKTKSVTSGLAPSVLGLLPFPNLLRSYLISIVSASPSLLGPSLRFLSRVAHSQYTFFQLERNPLLRLLVKKLFYAHFCAGETPPEVQRTITGLKNIGFTGVILSYAKEIVVNKETTLETGKHTEFEDVDTWKKGMLETVKLAQNNGYAALKYCYSYLFARESMPANTNLLQIFRRWPLSDMSTDGRIATKRFDQPGDDGNLRLRKVPRCRSFG